MLHMAVSPRWKMNIYPYTFLLNVLLTFSLTVVTMGLNIATYTQLYDDGLSSMTKPHPWYGHGEAGDTWPGVLD